MRPCPYVQQLTAIRNDHRGKTLQITESFATEEMRLNKRRRSTSDVELISKLQQLYNTYERMEKPPVNAATLSHYYFTTEQPVILIMASFPIVLLDISVSD